MKNVDIKTFENISCSDINLKMSKTRQYRLNDSQIHFIVTNFEKNHLHLNVIFKNLI